VDLLREPGVLAASLIVGLWYWRGSRRPGLHVVGVRRHEAFPWRGICFAAALVMIVVALDSPLTRLAEQRFWAHMLQHVLLMVGVAPLVVLGAPWLPLWRALPLTVRRRGAGLFADGKSFAWLRGSLVRIVAPIPAFVLFNVDLGLWHVPYFYDLTLRNGAVHAVEHLSFALLGVLFWIQLIDSPPFHARLQPFMRAIYATAGSATSWVLALVLALATKPIYPLQHVGHRGLSPLADQQVAAGMMIGPGSVPYAIVVFYWLYVWLASEDPQRRGRLRHATVRGETP
jgi:putative membrane protein